MSEPWCEMVEFIWPLKYRNKVYFPLKHTGFNKPWTNYANSAFASLNGPLRPSVLMWCKTVPEYYFTAQPTSIWKHKLCIKMVFKTEVQPRWSCQRWRWIIIFCKYFYPELYQVSYVKVSKIIYKAGCFTPTLNIGKAFLQRPFLSLVCLSFYRKGFWKRCFEQFAEY